MRQMKQVPEKECCTPGVRSGRLQAGKPVGGFADESWKSRCVAVSGGESLVGTRDPELPQDGEGPPRKVRLKPFSVDPYCVTNEWFAEFVDSTGYVTDAERYGWSLVFWSFTDPQGWTNVLRRHHGGARLMVPCEHGRMGLTPRLMVLQTTP